MLAEPFTLPHLTNDTIKLENQGYVYGRPVDVDSTLGFTTIF